MTGSAYAGQLACSTASPEDTLGRSVKANPRLRDFQVKYLLGSNPSVSGGTFWEEQRPGVLMDIIGESVQRPFEVGNDITPPLLEGM
jgi:hypothetical protein